jgi:bacteriorhodopsin
MKRYGLLISKPKNRLIGMLIGATILLFVPLIAMQFTNEVKWSLYDFIIAAILLFGAGLTVELFLEKVQNAKYRIIGLLIISVVVFLIWAELAVGILSTPFEGN